MTNHPTPTTNAEILKNDLRNQTMHSRASADLDLENTGRFAKPNIVIGVDGAQYPRLPASSPWHDDPVPTEESLGYDINAVEAQAEPHEIAKSLGAQQRRHLLLLTWAT
jgi:hypothetical protein